MNEHSAQTVAANMTLIVVTLLAATLIVVVPTWKRFLSFLEETPVEARRVSFRISAVFVGPPLVAILAGYFSLLISPDAWFHYVPDVFILMVFALTLPIILYVFPRWVVSELRSATSISDRARRLGIFSSTRRLMVTTFLLILGRRLWHGVRRRKQPGKDQMDPSKGAGAIGALGCFILTIVLGLFVAMAAIQVAIGVNIGGQSQREDFEFARAMIIAMPTTFAYGLACLGISYSVDLRRDSQDRKPSDVVR